MDNSFKSEEFPNYRSDIWEDWQYYYQWARSVHFWKSIWRYSLFQLCSAMISGYLGSLLCFQGYQSLCSYWDCLWSLDWPYQRWKWKLQQSLYQWDCQFHHSCLVRWFLSHWCLWCCKRSSDLQIDQIALGYWEYNQFNKFHSVRLSLRIGHCY